jgi:hypothetical protein
MHNIDTHLKGKQVVPLFFKYPSTFGWIISWNFLKIPSVFKGLTDSIERSQHFTFSVNLPTGEKDEGSLLVDFSKNLIDEQTLKLLLDLVIISSIIQVFFLF